MSKTLKIYIAGPMTGLVDANRHAFNGHASTLAEAGHLQADGRDRR